MEQTMNLLIFPLMFVSMILGPQDSCCRLDLSTSSAMPSELQVTVVNLQATPIVLNSQRETEFDLGIQIVGTADRAVPLTDYARQISTGERSGSALKSTLNFNETFIQSLDLRKLYILESDTYTITVSRYVFIGERRIELRDEITARIP